MSAELSSAAAFGVAGVTAFAGTPLAIRVARQTNFLDRPREYRQHEAPTPLLGGAAVVTAFLAAALLLTGVSGRLLVPLGLGIAMLLLGTLDDRVAVPPKWRVLAEVGAAITLYASGLGWHTAGGDVVNIGLTVLWIVGLVNAFNLMDNLDGACSTVTAVTAAGIGALALIRGDAPVAGLAFALSGACAGFLPWNLARPAKVFLGDGGSMPLGFLVATLAMTVTRQSEAGQAGLLAGALLAGLPILDVTLVSVSRTRRGVSVMTGGRDHLTHRILLGLDGPRSVAVTLAGAQAALSGLALLGYELGGGAVAGFAFLAFVAGVAVIIVLDSQRWRPTGIAIAAESPVAEPEGPASVGVDSG